jgi:hypothetical protein
MILCPDSVAAEKMLHDIADGQGTARLRSHRCSREKVFAKIEHVLDRRVFRDKRGKIFSFIAFPAQIMTPSDVGRRIFGVIDETGNDAAINTPFEDWVIRNVPFGMPFRPKPNFDPGTLDTVVCPKAAMAVDLVRSMEGSDRQIPTNQEVGRIEKLAELCVGMDGSFVPLGLLRQWTNNRGLVLSAIKARNEKGQTVGLVHFAPTT